MSDEREREKDRDDNLRSEVQRLKSELSTLRKERDSVAKERDAIERERDKAFTDRDRAVTLANEAKTEAKERHEEYKAAMGDRRKVEEERDSFAVLLQEIEADRDGLKARLEAEPNALQAKVDELSGKLRDVTHTAAFEKVAKANKVTDERRIKDLWKLSGYSPEGDEPDETRLAGVITEALKGRDWLLDAAVAATAPAGNTAPANGHAAHAAHPVAPHGTLPVRGDGTSVTLPQAPVPAAPARPGPGADRGQSIAGRTPAAAGAPWKL